MLGSLHRRLQECAGSGSCARGRAAAAGQGQPPKAPLAHLVLFPKAAHVLLLPRHGRLHPEQGDGEGLSTGSRHPRGSGR